MSDLVPADRIEQIVGTTRDATTHYARAVSSEQTVYILHPKRCLSRVIDLRNCPYSHALDMGTCEEDWGGFEDVAVAVDIDGYPRLVPVAGSEVERSRKAEEK